ncbi:MAG: hypothetical protein IPK58_11845 [Acidobacteria bacterium]|nr:hypothetical protein [Acidobacteriota bacterium]
MRTTAQGFGAPASNRQGYGLTEKDSTELNHTWFRKNENRAGRWTSPDPYNGSASVGNPQSWNRYSYVESQPTNFVDPSGLLTIVVRCEPDTGGSAPMEITTSELGIARRFTMIAAIPLDRPRFLRLRARLSKRQ